MINFSVDRLDDDCWELIFDRLKDNNYDLASVSLACKRFLLITNRVKVSLIISEFSLHLLPSLLLRFRNLKSIEICLNDHIETDPDRLISHILQSDLQHLQTIKCLADYVGLKYPLRNFHELGIKMKGLKSLNLTGFYYFCNNSLIELKNFFPCLEELVITDRKGYKPVTDDGLKALTSELKCLKKITLLSCGRITDKSVMSLSSNCMDLMDVSIKGCVSVSEKGIGFLLRNSPRLTSLSLSIWVESFWQNDSELTFQNSISYASNLENLVFSGSEVPDKVLYAIAKYPPPLKRFHYNKFERGVDNGLELLLISCSSIKEFSINCIWLTDAFFHRFYKHLGGLTHINISNCFGLGGATFSVLTKNCPLLESIVMCNTKVRAYEKANANVHQNYRMKHLDISGCSSMNDRALVRVGLICPNLEFLVISKCGKVITNAGVAEFLEVCPKLKHLDVSWLGVSNFLGQDKESKTKLTSVFANVTLIDDEAMEVIGRRCPDLEELNIEGCEKVMNDGVKKLMRKCEKLRKINLMGCKNVTTDLLEHVLNSRPLLKQIVAPSSFDLTEEQKNLCLRNGCMVRKGHY